MTMYREVLIESASQASALPYGTVAYWSYYNGNWETATRHAPTRPPLTATWSVTFSRAVDSDMVGWTALIPVEIVEESRTVLTESEPAPFDAVNFSLGSDRIYDDHGSDITDLCIAWASSLPTESRYVSEWVRDE